MDIFFYPNGRIDQATVHLTDVQQSHHGCLRGTGDVNDPRHGSPYRSAKTAGHSSNGSGPCFSRSRPGLEPRISAFQNKARHPVT